VVIQAEKAAEIPEALEILAVVPEVACPEASIPEASVSMGRLDPERQ